VDPTTEVEATAGGAAGSGSKYTGGRVTNQQVQQDPLTALANEHWRNPDGSLRPAATVTKYRPDLVDALFRDEIAPPSTSRHPRRASTTKDHAKAKGPKDHTDDKDHVKTSREGGEGSEALTRIGGQPHPAHYHPRRLRVMLLDILGYAEGYLWPHFTPDASATHVLSLILMINEKFRQGVEPFAWLISTPGPMGCDGTVEGGVKALVHRAVTCHAELLLTNNLNPDQENHHHNMLARTQYLSFFVILFQSLEIPAVRAQVLRLCSLPLWCSLSSTRRELEFALHPTVAKHWARLEKKEAKAMKKEPEGHVPMERRHEATFLPSLIESFFASLEAAVVMVKEGEDVDVGEEQKPRKQRHTLDKHDTSIVPTVRVSKAHIRLCERFLELVIDLLSQLPTRRFVHVILEERAVLVRARRSLLVTRAAARAAAATHPNGIERLDDQHQHYPGHPNLPHEGGGEGELVLQLLDLFQYYLDFEIDNHTGEPLSEDEITRQHYAKIQRFQALAFAHLPALHELALSHCGAVADPATLTSHLSRLDSPTLRRLATHQLRLLRSTDPSLDDPEYVMNVLVKHFRARPSRLEQIAQMPLYPNETVLFDARQVPSTHWTGETCLALPKLNLQFLSTHDYLMRNYQLFRLESTYEIRSDVMDVIRRVRATAMVAGAGGGNDLDVNHHPHAAYADAGEDPDSTEAATHATTTFTGWARMALPIASFAVTHVARPNVGEAKPAQVLAELDMDLSRCRPDLRAEWDAEVKQFDTLFLLSMRAPSAWARQRLRARLAQLDQPTRTLTYSSDDNTEVNKLALEAALCGLVTVRGCEVVEVKDEKGQLLNDFTGRVRREDVRPPQGTRRTWTVQLDTAQYQLDVDRVAEHGAEDVYGTFNLVMRRKAKENNWAAVLRCIRDLMESQGTLPSWLHDVFLGYGDPGGAGYRHLPHKLRTLHFVDTFMDLEHVRESFPGYDIDIVAAPTDVATTTSTAPLLPPYRLTFPEGEANRPNPHVVGAALGGVATTRRKGEKEGEGEGAGEGGSAGVRPRLVVESVPPPPTGPYGRDATRRNTVRFTPMQVEAIRSGVQPGLTMVVGPPGTGKTDTATQIINCLYHSCPEERILLVAHSNQALNDLFQKIIERDIPARYLLRLGMGEEELGSDLDFSRVGRTNAMLQRRLQLLAEVEKLAVLMKAPTDLAYSCETAAHFWLLHVLAPMEKFRYAASLQQRKAKDAAAAAAATDANAVYDDAGAWVRSSFPFVEYFADVPAPLFPGTSWEDDMRVAEQCFYHLQSIFVELEEARPFELLKTQGERVSYLTTKQAKIVAMTCTHAALKRHDFLRMGLQYDTLIMEESAQVLEIETFVPMLLQKSAVGAGAGAGAGGVHDGVNHDSADPPTSTSTSSRLKRIVLIGDHHQLPPVVQNMAIQKYARMDQSLFTRFVRLGVPHLMLNAQGRARPALARLYNWRYGGEEALGNLPHVSTLPRFVAANPGLAYPFQVKKK
jgi:intron-binding protein aquarius